MGRAHKDDVNPTQGVNKRQMRIALDLLFGYLPELEDKKIVANTQEDRMYITYMRQFLESSSHAFSENPDLFYHKSSMFIESTHTQLTKRDLKPSLEAFYIALKANEHKNVVLTQASAFSVISSAFVLYDSLIKHGSVSKAEYPDESGKKRTADFLARRTFTRTLSELDSQHLSNDQKRSKIELDDVD